MEPLVEETKQFFPRNRVTRQPEHVFKMCLKKVQGAFTAICPLLPQEEGLAMAFHFTDHGCKLMRLKGLSHVTGLQ
jgi:hypothetical protein